MLLCILGPPQAKKSWVRAPYREFLLVFARAVFAFCLEPHIGNFRGPRLLALLPRTPLDASCPALVVDGADFGVSWRVSLVSLPAPHPFAPVLPTPLSRGAPDGRESRPRPGHLPALVHFPSLSSEKQAPRIIRSSSRPPLSQSLWRLSVWRADTADGATNAPPPPSKSDKSKTQRPRATGNAPHRKVVRETTPSTS